MKLKVPDKEIQKIDEDVQHSRHGEVVEALKTIAVSCSESDKKLQQIVVKSIQSIEKLVEQNSQIIPELQTSNANISEQLERTNELLEILLKPRILTLERKNNVIQSAILTIQKD